jgi:hypothetical protein
MGDLGWAFLPPVPLLWVLRRPWAVRPREVFPRLWGLFEHYGIVNGGQQEHHPHHDCR